MSNLDNIPPMLLVSSLALSRTWQQIFLCTILYYGSACTVFILSTTCWCRINMIHHTLVYNEHDWSQFANIQPLKQIQKNMARFVTLYIILVLSVPYIYIIAIMSESLSGDSSSLCWLSDTALLLTQKRVKRGFKVPQHLLRENAPIHWCFVRHGPTSCGQPSCMDILCIYSRCLCLCHKGLCLRPL